MKHIIQKRPLHLEQIKTKTNHKIFNLKNISLKIGDVFYLGSKIYVGVIRKFGSKIYVGVIRKFKHKETRKLLILLDFV